jgi:hypothetical protein
MELLVAAIVANSGSSMRVKFSFLGAGRLEKRSDSGEAAREDRCDGRRDSGLLR